VAWIPRKAIVVPVDFSPESWAAVHEALPLATGPEALHVVHVLPPIVAADPAAAWEVQAGPADVERVRDLLARRLAEEGLAAAQVRVRVGDPGCEIAALADELRAELIVLPSHGRTGLRRLLIGSVAERVVRLAACPVLVLRNGGAS
jgi:nucleotide-binding universal stress UspA family protein